MTNKTPTLVERMAIITDFPDDFKGRIIPTLMICLYPPIELANKLISKSLDEIFNDDLRLIEGKKIKIGDYEYYSHSGFLVIYNSTIDQALVQFNNLIILFNLIGIPISFIKNYDLIIPIKEKNGKTKFYCTSKISLEKYTKSNITQPTIEELNKIMESCSILRNSINTNDFLKETQAYEFLALANLEILNQNYKISFINSWIFIEAILRNKWENLIEEKHKDCKISNGFKEYVKEFSPKKYQDGLLGDVRTWSIGVVIETLYQNNLLDYGFFALLQLLKQKRNDIFHFKKSKVKRTIDKSTAISALYAGRTLLFFDCGIDIKTAPKMLFSRIGNQIDQVLHGHLKS